MVHDGETFDSPFDVNIFLYYLVLVLIPASAKYIIGLRQVIYCETESFKTML